MQNDIDFLCSHFNVQTSLSQSCFFTSNSRKRYIHKLTIGISDSEEQIRRVFDNMIIEG